MAARAAAIAAADFSYAADGGGLSPRLKEALLRCEGAGEESEKMFQLLRVEIEHQVNSAVARILARIDNSTTIMKTASDSLRGELAGTEGILYHLQAAVGRFNDYFPQACTPPSLTAYSSTGEPSFLTTYMPLVLQAMHFMRSDMGGVFFLIQAWGFNGGCRRWALMIPAFLLSPPVILLWMAVVLLFRVLRAGVAISTFCSNTRLGACCCKHTGQQSEDIEMQGESPDPELSWIRRLYAAACHMVGTSPATTTSSMPDEPTYIRAADPSPSSTATGGGMGGFLSSTVFSSSRASLHAAFNI
jgi:hypothetical protein